VQIELNDTDCESRNEVKPLRYVQNHKNYRKPRSEIWGFGPSWKRAYSEFLSQLTAVFSFQLNNYATHITVKSAVVVQFFLDRQHRMSCN